MIGNSSPDFQGLGAAPPVDTGYVAASLRVQAAGHSAKAGGKLGVAISVFAHLAIFSAGYAWLKQAEPFHDPGSSSVDVMMVMAAPPPSVRLPAPAVPPMLASDLLPAPAVARPPPLPALSPELLPRPRLPAPAAPPVLAAELLPAPEIATPPPPPMLSAQLLPAPKLPVPPAPAALPPALLPPPEIVLPPRPPDPAGVLTAALSKTRAGQARAAAGVREKQRRQTRLRQMKLRQKKPQQAKFQQAKLQQAKLRQARIRKSKLLAEKRRAIARKQAREQALQRKRARERRDAQARQARRAQRIAKRSAQRAAARTRVASRHQAVSNSRRATRASRRGMSRSNWRSLIAARLRRNKPSGNVASLASGTAVVAFRIASNGAARSVRLVKSAGHSALDRAALATVRRASPFPPPPPGAGRAFRVPVSFRPR